MDDVSGQVLTLVAVVIGGAVSFVGAWGTEHLRWRRARAERWDTQTMDAYARYAGAMKHEVRITMRIAGGLGLGPRTEPLALEQGKTLHQEAEQERSMRFEAVLLLGNQQTVGAARVWQQSCWDLYLFCLSRASATPADIEEFTRLYEVVGRAREVFHEAARRSLGVAEGTVASTAMPSELPDAERRY